MGESSESNQEAPRGIPPDTVFKKMGADNRDRRLSPGNIKRNNTSSDNEMSKKGANNGTKIRFVVCTLGLVSLAMSQMSRMVLNLSITSMVDPSMRAKADASKVSSDGSCPWPEDSENSFITSTIDPAGYYSTTSDWVERSTEGEATTHSAVITTESVQLDSTETSVNITQVELVTCQEEDKFKWSIQQQSTLLGGFYYSYFFFMIVGGRVAEVYGAKYVLLLAVGGSALINLATPIMARKSFYLLVCSRILMGVIQSGVFPAMYALFNKWLTMSEASIYAPLIKMNLRLGMLLGSLIPGLLPNWPGVFYFTGIISALWSIAWFFIATSEPEGNSWVSKEELNHIMKKKAKPKPKEVDEVELEDRNANGSSGKNLKPKAKASLKTPWLKILTARPVIGLIIVKLTLNYAIDFLAIELPSYLKYVHHASTQRISFLVTLMFSIQVVLIVFVGWLAKSVVKRRPLGMSKTTIRKMFQGFSSFGIAFLLFLMSFNDCSIVVVGVLLQMTSFVSMFTAGGETMLPYDLSDQYPATIMAIANSVANLSGITTTVLAGLVLGDQGGSYARWNILIYVIVGANIVGGLAFLLLVKAERINFDESPKEESPKQCFKAVDVESGAIESAAANHDPVERPDGREETDDSKRKGQIKQVVENGSEKS